MMRMAAHFFILMPYMQGSLFFGIGVLKFQSIPKAIDFAKDNFWDGLKLAACYWPGVMMLLYAYVPIKYGNLFMDSFNLTW